jgi:hypothetical protein
VSAREKESRLNVVFASSIEYILIFAATFSAFAFPSSAMGYLPSV